MAITAARVWYEVLFKRNFYVEISFLERQVGRQHGAKPFLQILKRTCLVHLVERGTPEC